jgi:hypothetical protein
LLKAKHAGAFSAALNVPSAQGVHPTLLVLVAGLDTKLPAGHTLAGVHDGALLPVL